jgi:hypothetical protein
VLHIANGVGVDSTAMLVGLVKRGIRPNYILFADTGSEKPETYGYIAVINEFLRREGFPETQVVKYLPKEMHYTTLEEDCTTKGLLPSLAYGGKSCSIKWKIGAQRTFLRELPEVKAGWKQGKKVLTYVGYDAGPKDSRRGKDLEPNDKYREEYPLREWGWDRMRCRMEILSVGLPVPIKSACFMCPATSPEELVWLHYQHPDLFMRALHLEQLAMPKLRSVEGLWRSSRVKTNRPGSWVKWALQNGMAATLPDGSLVHQPIQYTTPPEFPAREYYSCK